MIDVTAGRCALAAAAMLFAVAIPSRADVHFGNDSSEWAFDGECDDPRFIGSGMADILLEEDLLADATDCQQLFEAGLIRLRVGDSSVPGAVDFGVDTSEWVFDGECDDPRFVGDGMAEVLLEEDLLADATDCRLLYESGRIRLRPDGGKFFAGDSVRAQAVREGVAAYGALEAGDDTLDDGEYCDYFSFEGHAGALAVVVLRTEQFDPYLIVRAPSGEQIDNDDHEGDASRSLVTFPMHEDGMYTVGVTSYEAGEVGAYSLLVQIQADAPTPTAVPSTGEIGVRSVAPGPGSGELLAGVDMSSAMLVP